MANLCPLTGEKTIYQQCQECEESCMYNKTSSGSEVKDPVFHCVVTGSRDYTNYAQMERYLNILLSNYSNVEIVSGGARGADTLARDYAKNHNYAYKEFPADWEKDGKRAGVLRNEEMQKYIAAFPKRGCVAFWDGESPGTKNSLQLAERYGTQVKIIRFEKEGD